MSRPPHEEEPANAVCLDIKEKLELPWLNTNHPCSSAEHVFFTWTMALETNNGLRNQPPRRSDSWAQASMLREMVAAVTTGFMKKPFLITIKLIWSWALNPATLPLTHLGCITLPRTFFPECWAERWGPWESEMVWCCVGSTWSQTTHSLQTRLWMLGWCWAWCSDPSTRHSWSWWRAASARAFSRWPRQPCSLGFGSVSFLSFLAVENKKVKWPLTL